LGIEHVALFYAHRHEFSRPIEEVAETMAGFVAEGKIGAYGLSEVSPGTLRRAHAVFPCAAVQNEYSLWTRQPELGLIQACAETGTSFVPFSPLSRGALGQEMIDPNSLQMDDFRRKIPRFIGKDWTLNQPLIAAFRDVARNFGHSVPELALAWILDQGPHLIPVPGTRSAEHLLDWVNASEISLTDDHRAAIAMTLPVGWAYGDRYNDEQAMTVARYC
jgi:aryl-alcohol dehydrogenase-like predicted oxidoreductase